MSTSLRHPAARSHIAMCELLDELSAFVDNNAPTEEKRNGLLRAIRAAKADVLSFPRLPYRQPPIFPQKCLASGVGMAEGWLIDGVVTIARYDDVLRHLHETMPEKDANVTSTDQIHDLLEAGEWQHHEVVWTTWELMGDCTTMYQADGTELVQVHEAECWKCKSDVTFTYESPYCPECLSSLD